MTVNPKTMTLVNPTQGTDQNGNTVAWDGATDFAGFVLVFDGGPPVTVELPAEVTSLDLTTLDAYKALSTGEHTLVVADFTKEGAVGAFAAPVSFSIAVTPLAPTAVMVA